MFGVWCEVIWSSIVGFELVGYYWPYCGSVALEGAQS